MQQGPFLHGNQVLGKCGGRGALVVKVDHDAEIRVCLLLIHAGDDAFPILGKGEQFAGGAGPVAQLGPQPDCSHCFNLLFAGSGSACAMNPNSCWKRRTSSLSSFASFTT